jgi:PAP2 superfamily
LFWTNSSDASTLEMTMNWLETLLSPPVIGLVAIFLSILWMLRDEKDTTRPLLVFALILNLFYGFLLTVVLGSEDSLIPRKFDPILLLMDGALGVSAAGIALPLQGAWLTPLILIYRLLLPMMIFWFLITHGPDRRKALLVAYIAELVIGPLLYALLPACGPIYAFGVHWLDPPHMQYGEIRLGGMPNAFPSLHIGTAFIFVLFAQRRLWRMLSLAFLLGTALATIATGEHYVIDLIPGLAFGCFAANVGYRKIRTALFYLGIVLAWSLAVRFAGILLIATPVLVRSAALVTIALAGWATWKAWRMAAVDANASERLIEVGIPPQESE